MPFVALNANEENLKKEEERHTFEFQLEDAFKLYTEALELQKNGAFEEAARTFAELLAFPLFDLDNHKNVPPNTPRLKGLVLKNYAILLLDNSSDDPKLIISLLLGALELCPDDPYIIELLCVVSLSLGYPKIARLALESLVTDVGSQKALSILEASLSKNKNVVPSPRNEHFLHKLAEIITSVGDSPGKISGVAWPVFDKHWTWLEAFGSNSLQDLKTQLSGPSSQLKVPVATKTLTILACALEDAVSSHSRKRKREFVDDYSYSNRPINAVEFVAPQMVPNVELKPTIFEDANEAPEQEQELEAEAEQESVNPEAEDSLQKAEITPPVQELTVPVTPVRTLRRTQDYSMSADFGSQDLAFASQISLYLKTLGLEYHTVVEPFRSGTVPTPENQIYFDLKNILESWDNNEAALFLNAGAATADVSQPVMQMLDFAAIQQDKGDAIVDPPVDEAILSQSHQHVQSVRFKVLKSIVCSQGECGPLIANARLSAILMKHLPTLMETFNNDVLEQARSAPNLEVAEIAQAFYEWYMDSYLEVSRNIRKSQNEDPEKKLPDDWVKRQELFKHRVRLWKAVVEDLLSTLPSITQQLQLRYKWVSIFYYQIEGEEPNDSMERLESMTKPLTGVSISFANYKNIPSASTQDANTQISKFRAASVFAKVWKSAGSDNLAEPVQLLEAMLMPESHPNSLPESQAISQFLESASLDFKLNLWYLLLENYEKMGEKIKARDGLLKILRNSIDECFSADSTVKRGRCLLQCFAVAQDIGKRLLPLLTQNSQILSDMKPEEAKQHLAVIVKLLEFLQIFMLCDQAINSNLTQAPQHHTWEKAATQLRELTVVWWVIFYYFFRAACVNPSNDVINDIMSIIHEELGHAGYCALADGSLLKLNISEILRLDWFESEADLLQCLNCRYGISLSTDNFVPYNHHTASVELTRADAIPLSKFIMRMILSRKNFYQAIQRNNVRQVLDLFTEAIGFDDHIYQIQQNEGILDHFLEKEIDATFLKQASEGKLRDPFLSSHDPTVELIGNGGFYFVIGIVNLTQYRVKKRVSPDRVDDLHTAIKYFKNDLCYGTQRFESWACLGQAFDALYEVSYTFTPPEVQQNSGEAIRYLRKAILCTSMAHSILLARDPTTGLSLDFFKSTKEKLFSDYGRLLYNSAVSPISMQVFTPQKRLVFLDSKPEEKILGKSMNQKTILRLSFKYLGFATDWFSSFLRAKILHDLGASASEVLDEAVEASRLAQSMIKDSKANQDSSFEALQFIILLAAHYCRESKIEPDKALKYLVDTGLVPANIVEENPPPSVIAVSHFELEALKGIVTADKKHWLHRPVYWLARLYEDVYNLPESAQLQMEKLIAVKSTSRPLVNIWKPDFEAPGKHFDYCRDYAMYYTDLVFKNKDDVSMYLLAKKARKFTAMTDVPGVWAHICNNLCTLVRILLDIPKKFTEKVVPALNPDEFDIKSAKIDKWVQSQETFSPWVLALEYALDVKKLNIGLGSTVAVDELVIMVYMAMYELVPEIDAVVLEDQSNDAAASATNPAPNANASETGTLTTTPFGEQTKQEKKKVRVTRKDVLQKATQALKPVSTKLNARSEAKCIPTEIRYAGAQLHLHMQHNEKTLASSEAPNTPVVASSGAPVSELVSSQHNEHPGVQIAPKS